MQRAIGKNFRKKYVAQKCSTLKELVVKNLNPRQLNTILIELYLN